MMRIIPFRVDADTFETIVQYAHDSGFIKADGSENISAAVYSLVVLGLRDYAGQDVARDAYVLARNSLLMEVKARLNKIMYQLAQEL